MSIHGGGGGRGEALTSHVQSGCTGFTFHGSNTRVPIAPYLRQHLLLSVLSFCHSDRRVVVSLHDF